MLQDFVQVNLLGTGVRKWCAPPFVHTPPPHPVVPRPARTPSPFSRTWEHTGSLRLIFAPPLRSCAAPFAFARVAPCPARTLFAPPPFAPPIVPCSLPSCAVPCERPSPDMWPPCVWRSLRGPPLVRTPVPPALPACAQKGVRVWWGMQTEGGRGAGQVEGTATNGKGGHHPLCPLACVQRARRGAS